MKMTWATTSPSLRFDTKLSFIFPSHEQDWFRLFIYMHDPTWRLGPYDQHATILIQSHIIINFFVSTNRNRFVTFIEAQWAHLLCVVRIVIVDLTIDGWIYSDCLVSAAQSDRVINVVIYNINNNWSAHSFGL